jgi:uncharacterized coiled-coil protein SlyX|uniref:Uncharacterized protein n=1 Tax=viral metagenome TaxID=1070528 RepID=A0A6C0BH03_9ZZZZ
MAAMKKHIELLEMKMHDLEQTIAHQKEIMNMMNTTMNNQKMVIEMIISRLNNLPHNTVVASSVPSVHSDVTNATPQITSQTSSDKTKITSNDTIFPINRRTMV